jgi:hypothetical protein
LFLIAGELLCEHLCEVEALVAHNTPDWAYAIRVPDSGKFPTLRERFAIRRPCMQAVQAPFDRFRFDDDGLM